MKSLFGKNMKVIALTLTILLLGACSNSPDPRLYLLQSVAGAANFGDTNQNDLTIEIGEISLPKHLSGDRIITYVEPNQVVAAEFDRWAEPLDWNISSVIARNLSSLLGTAVVLDYRSNLKITPVFTVEVSIIEFSIYPGRKVSLVALWSLQDASGKNMAVRSFNMQKPSPGGNYVHAVRDMSELIGILTEEIARAIVEAG